MMSISIVWLNFLDIEWKSSKLQKVLEVKLFFDTMILKLDLARDSNWRIFHVYLNSFLN